LADTLVALLIELGISDTETLKHVSGPLIKEKHGAPLIGCGHSKWYEHMRAGDLEPVRIGGNTFVTASSLKKLIERSRAKAPRTVRSDNLKRSAI
jgi:hypothetical protein